MNTFVFYFYLVFDCKVGKVFTLRHQKLVGLKFSSSYHFASILMKLAIAGGDRVNKFFN